MISDIPWPQQGALPMVTCTGSALTGLRSGRQAREDTNVDAGWSILLVGVGLSDNFLGSMRKNVFVRSITKW